ncbi:MAG: putative quinol monooxygenase [Roseiarcus sp.]
MTLCAPIGTVVTKDETREELRTILADQAAPTRAEAVCVNYDFHVDAKDPNVFAFYENWKSRADLDAHLKTPHLQPLFGRLEQLLAQPVEMRFLTMISELAP